MATLAPRRLAVASDARFFFLSSITMAIVLVAGFSTQLAMGRSSFGAPPLIHFHALTFFGWTTFFVLQAWLAATGSVSLHRRLGWLAAGWAPLMVVLGTSITVAMVRRGGAPFFFTPAYFLIGNPLTVFTFAALTAAALTLRRRTQWHRRLLICGMAILTGPGWGRLLPLPLVIPYAGLTVFAATALFPLAGMIRDRRATGRVHPAWIWGFGTMALMQMAMETLPRTPLGPAIYAAATTGAPAASTAPLAYPPPPWLAHRP